MNKDKTPLIILGIAAVLLAVCAIQPLFLSIGRNSETMKAQRVALAELEKKSENLKIFQSTYEVYQENLNKIDKLFVDREEPVEFIEFLEKEAVKSKLGIDLTPLTTKVGDDEIWSSISFQADMSGSFQGFLRFLSKLEASPYLLSLSDFSLTRSQKSTNNDILFSFQMKVYTK